MKLTMLLFLTVLMTVSNSNNTNVTVPNINITTSDPVKEGQSVREELNKANRSFVRNGQSAVLL
jgi:hypothetical protein